MASTLKWASPETVATALTTELDSLADGALSAVSGALDNTDTTTGLDEYIVFETSLASINPSGTPFVSVYIFYSHGGTNYEDASTSASHALACNIPVTTGSSAKLAMSRAVLLLPFKCKFALQNGTGVSFAGSGSTLKYRRFNENDV